MSFWNDTLETALREHVEAGLSAAAIGKQLGCTKGTVIGKVRRLRLQLKGVRGGNMKAGKRRRRRVAEAVAPPALMDLTNTTCRWPLGDVGKPDFRFCGGPANLESGQPYCETHSALAYNR